MDWDNLKFLLAVAEGGSIAVAARNLETDKQNVGRRIEALEADLNCELASRGPDGSIIITAAGRRAVAVARAIFTQVAALAAEVGGEHGELTGTLCVTSTAGFVPRAMKAFEVLREKYPGLDIDVMVSSHVVDLKRKEADMAVRFFKDEQPGLYRHMLGVMGWSLYASEKYLAGRARNAEDVVAGHQFIAYDGNFSNTSGGRWIKANVPDEQIVLRVGGIRQALDAAALHQGVCIVPCYLSDEHKVVRITDKVLTTNDVYAVFLAERENEPRMRVVVDALLELFEKNKVEFAGTV